MKRALTVLISAVVLAAIGSGAQTTDGKKSLPWLGMGIRSFRDASGQRFLHVDHTAPGGPAARAGVRPGDIIANAGTALQIGDDLDFLMFLAQHKPGERLPMRIIRYGETIDVVVTFAQMPETVRAAWDHTVEAARRKRLSAAQAKIH